MIFRVISFDCPERSAPQLQASRLLARTWSTEWRGTVAIIGERRVWAIADLVDVTPRATGAGGYWWRFENVRPVEGVDCGHYTNDRYDGPDGSIPTNLNAFAQWRLNQMFAVEAPPEPPAPEMPAAVLDLAAAGTGAQLLLF